ncbi:MAG: S41 family peptidase [Planctomycetota bacterium]
MLRSASFVLPALVLAACGTLSEAEQRRLRVFDAYVEALAADYPFFAQKHIDWQGLARTYRSAVVSAQHPDEFYHLLAGLFAELDDPHVTLDVPLANWRDGDVGARSLLDVPGFEVRSVDRGIYVKAWPAGAEVVPPDHLPAAMADLPQIVRVNGARVTLPLLRPLMLGAPGSAVELQLCWADGTKTRHTLRRPAEATFVVHGTVRRGLPQVAWCDEFAGRSLVRLTTLDADDCGADVQGFRDHLDAVLDTAAGRTGTILDLRDNGGGQVSVASCVLGRFLDHDVEVVTAAQRESWLFGLVTVETFGTLKFEPRPKRLGGPLVVWTSWRTGSAAELLTRLLQRECGAVVIGEQTIGAEASLVEVAAEDGTTLGFGRDRLLDERGVGFQDEGVTPDVAVRLTIDDVRRCGSFPAAHDEWERRLRAATERAFAAAAARQDG